MLWDITYDPGGNRAVFFHAKLSDGMLEVPPDEASALATLGNVKEGAA
jgi:hypothetical protein